MTKIAKETWKSIAVEYFTTSSANEAFRLMNEALGKHKGRIAEVKMYLNATEQGFAKEEYTWRDHLVWYIKQQGRFFTCNLVGHNFVDPRITNLDEPQRWETCTRCQLEREIVNLPIKKPVAKLIERKI